MNALAFELPAGLEATSPPEHRDEVRLLVAHQADGELTDARFTDLPDQLHAGDLLVINVSATLPAALAAARQDGTPVRVHVSTPVPGRGPDDRVVELRSPDGSTPLRLDRGERVALGDEATLRLIHPYTHGNRLMVARYDGPESLMRHLTRHGEPIRYGYAAERWPLADYQTVYATTPGSSEMPSAGRPFSRELMVAMIARGIGFAPIVLHCGVSSPERHEPPFPEPYEVPETTARRVNETRADGGRVIAVGTTVVRALETVADEHGHLERGAGWTSVVVTPETGGVRAVDGLITGWHEPQASHLQMLEAIAGGELLARSYEHALSHSYLWHEFGDSHLILP
jgi:S-adenosylmethionine:tRNA ribosyltransferase-isomerase